MDAREYEQHLKICSKKRCWRCGQHIDVQEFIRHQQDCQKRICGKCKMVFHIQDYDRHSLICEHKTCTKCWKRLPRQELADHLQAHEKESYTCLCGQVVAQSERDIHLLSCTRPLQSHCEVCKQWIDISELEKHTCQVFYCPKCRHLLRVERQQTHTSWCHLFSCHWCEVLFTTKHDLAAHKQVCCLRHCRRCGSYYNNVQQISAASHKAECPIHECLLCGTFIAVQDKDSHESRSQFWKCVRCNRKKYQPANLPLMTVDLSDVSTANALSMHMILKFEVFTSKIVYSQNALNVMIGSRELRLLRI
ncbi:hypothetical protein F5B21DRAFT_331360 [Xylaria acuta]|nr:hypothetical protein F5B21DRAFT_331360 [Xylaria acuta]